MPPQTSHATTETPGDSESSAQTDSESVRSEDRLLRLFVGPNADTFVQIHHRMEQANSKLWQPHWYGFNWIVLIVPAAWFFYRKMFLAGAAILLLPPILILVFPGLAMVSMGALVGMLVTMSNRWYVEHGLRKIKKIEALNLPPNERDAQIKQSGGTSKFGAGVGGLIYAAFFALLFVPVPAMMAAVPSCANSDVVATTEETARNSIKPTGPNAVIENVSLSNVALVDELADPPLRRCRATLHVDGEEMEVFYTVAWNDPSGQRFKIVLGPNLESLPN